MSEVHDQYISEENNFLSNLSDNDILIETLNKMWLKEVGGANIRRSRAYVEVFYYKVLFYSSKAPRPKEAYEGFYIVKSNNFQKFYSTSEGVFKFLRNANLTPKFKVGGSE